MRAHVLKHKHEFALDWVRGYMWVFTDGEALSLEYWDYSLSN